jgi:hypothetical protein
VSRTLRKWTVYRGSKFASSPIDPRLSDDELVEAINVSIAAEIRAQSDNPSAP